MPWRDFTFLPTSSSTSHEDVAYWRDSLNHVLARALREGRVLYERR